MIMRNTMEDIQTQDTQNIIANSVIQESQSNYPLQLSMWENHRLSWSILLMRIKKKWIPVQCLPSWSRKTSRPKSEQCKKKFLIWTQISKDWKRKSESIMRNAISMGKTSKMQTERKWLNLKSEWIKTLRLSELISTKIRDQEQKAKFQMTQFKTWKLGSDPRCNKWEKISYKSWETNFQTRWRPFRKDMIRDLRKSSLKLERLGSKQLKIQLSLKNSNDRSMIWRK